jgi:MFS family permease
MLLQPLITKASFVGMAYMFGMLVGSFICGILSDRIGRKKTLLIAIFVTFASALGGAFVKQYWPYLVLRKVKAINH